MKFHDFPTGWDDLVRSGVARILGLNRFEDTIDMFLQLEVQDPISWRHGMFLKQWYEIGRPYYNVYPCVVPMLTDISLQFPGSSVTRPSGLRDLLLRFPADNSAGLVEDDVIVRSIFLSFQPVNRAIGLNQPEPGIVIGIDIGETDTIMDRLCTFPVFTLKIFPLDERYVEETINAFPNSPSMYSGIAFPGGLLKRCLNLAIAVCMIQAHPDILEPDYLNVDINKVTRDNAAKLQAKAIQRGKFGFNLGGHMEVIPHLRRPHPALMWTGHGRTVPRIVFRKGSLVHREVIEKIPTGKENSYGSNASTREGEVL